MGGGENRRKGDQNLFDLLNLIKDNLVNVILSVAQLGSAIQYLSYFPAAANMFPSLSSSTSMTSSTMFSDI